MFSGRAHGRPVDVESHAGESIAGRPDAKACDRPDRSVEQNWKSPGGIRVHSLRGWSSYFEAAALVARVNRAWSGASRRGPMGPPGLQRNHLVSKPGFAQRYGTWKTATRS
jgi:hypothetical protein